ncbi:MAG: SPFH domain-containing protein [Candidatus Sulfotelmatobacter sp.]
MNADDIWAIVFLLGGAALLLLRFYGKRTVRVFVTDYQRGVRFVNGAFRDVLGPGSYYSSRTREQITIVDIRPKLVVFERIFYEDAFHAPSVVSFAAELSVGDPYRAITQMKYPINDSIAIIRDQLQSVVSQSIANTEPATRDKSANEIAAALNRELGKFGMQVANLEILEMWSRSVRPETITGAN